MDRWLLLELNQWAGWGYWTDYAAYFFAQFGLLLEVILLVVCWFGPGARVQSRRHAVLLAVAASIFAEGIAEFITAFYYRPRPNATLHEVFTLINTPATASFPSSHATAVGAIACILWSQWSRSWGAASWAVAIATALSRTYAGLHYATDSIAGLLLGAVTAHFLQPLLPGLKPVLNRFAPPPKWEPPPD